MWSQSPYQRRKKGQSQRDWEVLHCQKRHRECRQPLRGKETDYPLLPEGTHSYYHLDFSPMKCILDFRPPELQDNTFVLFKATKRVLICYSSNRKLIYWFRVFRLFRQNIHLRLSPGSVCVLAVWPGARYATFCASVFPFVHGNDDSTYTSKSFYDN